MKETTRELGVALCGALNGSEWYRSERGGFAVCVDNKWGRYTDSVARKITGISAPTRPKRALATTGAAGEWNALCALVNAVSRGTR